jgi:hypothetical protein
VYHLASAFLFLRFLLPFGQNYSPPPLFVLAFLLLDVGGVQFRFVLEKQPTLFCRAMIFTVSILPTTTITLQLNVDTALRLSCLLFFFPLQSIVG